MTETVKQYEPLDTNGSLTPKKVAYFYDTDVGNYAYNAGHPMKPHRIRMAHSLIMNYGLYKKMEIYRAKPASRYEMTQFHTDEYVDFLQKVTPDNMESFLKEQGKYNVGDDCPVFDGLFEFCGISAGGSMEGAARLNREKCDVAVNWAGGLHHAKKSEASGFCYINDIVLGIIELLRFKSRVLYIDIDVHHGDGVEEAFYSTDRVMCVSFHKYGEYFPGTGELRDIGVGNGKYHSVNFPLRDGIDDESYKSIFEPVIGKVMEYYRPEAVVLQCGGDSLSGDRLGCFNLSMKGHANCVAFVKSFNLPTMILGGGGYTMRNVARTWAYETGQLVGQVMGPNMPYTDYYEYYAPDYELNVRPSNMDNANSPEYLEKIKTQLIENLRMTAAAPSVQMTEVPRGPVYSAPNPDDPEAEGNTEDFDEREARLDDLDEDENKDVRNTQRRWDQRIERDDELYDSEDEECKAANGVKNQNGEAVRRPRITDFENPNADHEPDVPTEDKMALDSPLEIPVETTNANAAVSSELLAAKADAPVQSAPMSTAATVDGPIAVPGADGEDKADVVMADSASAGADASGVGDAKTGSTGDASGKADDAVEKEMEKESGEQQRTEADDAGEQKREADAPGGTV